MWEIKYVKVKGKLQVPGRGVSIQFTVLHREGLESASFCIPGVADALSK